MLLNMMHARRAMNWAVVLLAALVITLADGGDVEAQTRTERFFDDWNVLCLERDDGVKQCRMTQTLVQNNSKREVFRWVVAMNQEDEMESLLSAPLGVNLRQGIELVLGGDEPVSVPYEVCGRRWCQARMPMSAGMAELLGAGMPVQVTYVNPRGQRLQMEVTARGFREAFNYLQSQLGS